VQAKRDSYKYRGRCPKPKVSRLQSAACAFAWFDINGKPCGKQTIGLLQRRHVRVERIIYIGKESNSLEEGGSGTIHAAQNVYTEYPDPRRDEWQTKILPALKKLPVSALRLFSHKSRSMLYRARAGRSRPRIKNQKLLASILRRMEIA